jgi:glutathione S-transferase
MQVKNDPAIVLYRHALSGHCHRVELFTQLLGLPLTLVDVDLRQGEQRTEAFLKLNPFGQVPVIDDSGTVVTDSNAILTYLALRYAPEHWLPREPLAAARVQQWLSIAAGPLASSAAAARVVHVFKLPRDASPAVKEAHMLFKRMDSALALHGAPWITGAALPSIADLALYAYTAHAPEGGIALDDYPTLRAWLGRVEALPGFVAMQPTACGLNAA